MNKYNLFDYLIWRDGIDFNTLAFNEIDNIVLANLSYIRFKTIIPSDKSTITISDAIDAFLKTDITSLDIRDKQDIEFLKALKVCSRFNQLKLTFHHEIYDEKTATQFAAWMVEIKHNLYYLVYRGTDNFLAGWREDLNLSFETVEAQRLACQYLEDASKNYPFAKFIIAGHSKGGNLAMYAAAHASKHAYNKIIRIYNNDGPGFDFNHVDYAKYEKIADKLISFTPGFSFVGQMMRQPKELIIIESDAYHVLQHSMYNWQIKGNELIRINQYEPTALAYKYALDNCLKTMDLTQRRKFVDGSYKIISAANTDDISQMIPGLIKNHKEVQRVLKTLDDATRKAIETFFSELFDSMKDSIGYSIGNFGTSLYTKIFGHDKTTHK